MLAKLLSAVALTVLASTQSLLVELAKSLNGGATPFDTPSAVFFTELLKLLIALALWLRERPSLEYDGLSGWQFTPFLLFAIPALLFIVQNNAVFLAMELLDPPTFQLWACFKVIPVGVLARVALGQRRSRVQWAALLLLALGMAVTTLGAEKSKHGLSRLGTSRQARGILVLVANGCLSATSGILNEWLIKYQDPKAPLMFKNAQLYFFGILVAAVGLKASAARDFSALAWIIVGTNAAAGLCVSLVLKYADNLIKGFSTSASVLLAALVSSIAFSIELRRPFVLGAAVVCVAFYLYFGPHNKVLLDADDAEEEGEGEALLEEGTPAPASLAPKGRAIAPAT